MGQPRAPRVDWKLEAWHLAELLQHVPSRRRSIDGIALPMGDIQDEDAIRHDDIIRHFDALLAKVNAQMNHAVGKAVRTAAQREQMPRFEGTSARGVIATADDVLAKMSDTDSDLAVVDIGVAVHKALAFVRQHHFLSDDQRLKLPVIVAAMAGRSSAVANQIRAAAPRARRQMNRLRAAKLEELEEKPANWRTLLYRLKAKGIVVRFDDAVIHWKDNRGVEQTTALSTFQRWKSQSTKKFGG